jgi:hypothetical protein
MPFKSLELHALSEFRPPLADELFEPRDSFRSVWTRYPIEGILPHLVGGSVESELEMLRRSPDSDAAIPRQLAAVKFYLRDIIQTCDRNWKRLLGAASNYSGFLDEIESWRQSTTDVEEIFLVTFNYDTLLEDALTRSLRIEKQFKNVSDYVLGPYKVIKPHGSINWAHEVSRPQGLDHVTSNVDAVNNAIIRNISNLERIKAIANEIRLFSEYSTTEWFLPALSIPVEQKADYECPPNHMQTLVDFLPRVEGIITIGWRAMEDSFVKLLVKTLRPGVKTYVISRNQESANSITDHLRKKGLPGKIVASPSEGFSAVTRTRDVVTDFLIDIYGGEYRKEYYADLTDAFKP